VIKKRIKMKSLFFMMIVLLGVSACSVKKEPLSEPEYKRSNMASEKALERLDRE
jgi:hypothetical protein